MTNLMKKTLQTGAAVMAAMLLLTGCTPSAGNPANEDYKNINSFLEKIDYDSAGTVASTAYNNYRAEMNPPQPISFHAYIEGEQAFDTLLSRIQHITTSDCVYISPEETECTVGVIKTNLYQSEGNYSTSMRVEDMSSVMNDFS